MAQAIARPLNARVRALSDRRAALLVGMAGALLIALVDLAVRDEPVPRGDDRIYELMARDPLGTHTFPFAYRIGLPWLVHVLPFGHTFSFGALAVLSTGACSAIVYLLLRHFGVSRRLAAALGLCLAISPPLVIVALRQGRNTDPETLAIMLAGTLAIVDRRPALLAAVMLAGATLRESALFLGPLAYAVWAQRPLDGDALRRALAATAPAAALYVGLRLAIPTVGREQVPGYGGSLLGGRIDVALDGLRDAPTQLRRLFTIYGPLWLAAPFALLSLRFARRGLVLVVLCVAAMTFALDWGRIILLAAPVFYVAGGHVLTRRARLALLAVAAFAALDVTYAAYMHLSGVESGIIGVGPPPYPVR